MYLNTKSNIHCCFGTYITNCNHKVLGLYYLWLALIFGFFGALCSMIIRIELASSGMKLISIENQNFYNLIFTLHGLFMIFFNVMPGLLSALGNYFIPIFNTSADIAFPRLNSISLFLLPLAYTLILLSLISEFGVGAGWTLYPPNSTSSGSGSVDVVILALIITGLSSLFTSCNFLTTVFHCRVSGYHLGILPASLYSWGIMISSILLIVTLPVLTGSFLMLISDIHFNSLYFDPLFTGDPVFYQHLFWFFGHPEVYVMIIPGFVVISVIISSYSNSLIFGNQSMILAIVCIAILGCLVWAHHMFSVGLESDTVAYFTTVTILISIPTGTKIFNWLCTYIGSYFPLGVSYTSAAFLVSLFFLCTFTLGGTTGVQLGNAALDISLHDTYYVVGHFHFVLSLGAVLALVASMVYFQLIFLGRLPLKGSSIIIIWSIIFFTSVLLVFIPMHFMGFNGMPRRIPDYPDIYNSWNSLSSIGSISVFVSLLILLAAL